MAIVTIKNMDDLIKIVEARISQAFKMTQDEIYKVVQRHIKEYYKEKVFSGGTSSIPDMYTRTYKLLNSLIKTDIVTSTGGISCTVEIDPNYLNYTYPGGATGISVARSADEYFHGWAVKGDIQIWKDSLEELGMEQGILELMKSNLKRCGLPIK